MCVRACVNVAIHLSIFCMIDQHRHEELNVQPALEYVMINENVVMGGRLSQSEVFPPT